MTTLKTDSERWIHRLCRQFSDATGWPLSYRSVEFEQFADEQEPGESVCWHSDIHDGIERVGRLKIDLPERARNDRSYLAVVEIADVVGQMLNRLARSSRVLESRAQQVSTLVDVGKSFYLEQDLDGALQRLLAAGLELTGYRAAGFFLLNPNDQELGLRVQYRLDGQVFPFPKRKLAESPFDIQAITEGTVIVNRSQTPELACWLPMGTATGMCLPVQSSEGPFGTLWVFDRRSRTPSARIKHVLESIATQIASVLERTVLLHESETQQRFRRELQLACEGKPQEFRCFEAEDRRFEAALRSTSRAELGGDLCELIPYRSDQTAIAVGDASGDSIPAALVMSIVRGALHTLLDETEGSTCADDTIDVMQRINQALYLTTPPHQFMSMLYGVIDTSKMTFKYTNAGHPTPIFIRKSGEIVDVTSHGMLLGVMDRATYESSELELEPDDLIVCYSDGVSEAMSNSRKMFRSEGIMEAIQASTSSSAESVLQSIWNRLETHLSGGGRLDDRTVLVIKIRE
ncbi:MAG: SpoIIE family protein phosphatase [Planctomycetota bacterium]|nr:SpoIIE family protein phosphatase [Planctomycetota bacterium]MDA1214925.1 SpoIIE family protein phosphatase [Planctomycetota bacterium]